MTDEPRTRDRDKIKAVLVYALRHRAGIRWARDSERDAEIAADRILDHLALSNVRMSIGEPRRAHSTPGVGISADGVPFSMRPAWCAAVRGARR